MKNDRVIGFISALLMGVSGCVPSSSVEPAGEITPAYETTPTAQIAEIPAPSPTALPAIFPSGLLNEEQGALLFIQTGFYEYRYLNPITQTSYLVDPPISDPQFRLRSNLSPSGTKMLFPQEHKTGIIADLRTGEIIHFYDFSSPALFNPEMAAIEAKPWVTELDLTEVGLLEAVTQAHQSSRQLLRWYQTDRYHLSVHDTGPASTGLFLDDHQTGVRHQLEDQPGLVEDYRIGPDGNQILLKKGLIFNPGTHRDKHYYLINVSEQSIQPILLPADTQNPSVTWFDKNTIGVIHHAFMAGGVGFSRINTVTMEATQVITGDFSELRRFGDYLFIIQRETDAETTTFNLLTLQGASVASQQIDRQCFIQFTVSNRFIFQCELESFLLDQNLNVEPFIDFVLNLSPAPDGSSFVMMNRSEQSFLLDAELNVQYELPLEEIPLEIQWLPNSNGFIYRTHTSLYYYDLTTQSVEHLLESDLFSDYTNINAVWVNLD